MKVILLIFIARAFALSPNEVRVRLKHEARVVEVSGYNLTITPPSAFIPVKFTPGLMHARISSAAKGGWALAWRNGSGAEQIVSERLWVRGEHLRIGRREVPADFEIYRDSKKGLDVMARLDLNEYLEGVLPSEMPLAWPTEALKAQVVAARSYVLRQITEHRDKEFDVEDGIEDQVYKFRSGGNYENKLREVLRQTRGEVLTAPNRAVLKAFYSADCGCRSEDPKFVWGGIEHGLESFQSVEDPTCHDRKVTEWNFVLRMSEARERLIEALSLPPETTLKTLLLGGRTPSGRVSEVVATMTIEGKDLNYVLGTQEFRRVMGYSRVRSADFKLRWSGREILISGSGLGHGVGLCQRGARAMAEQGMKHDEILRTYYPKAKLVSSRERYL